MNREDSKKRRYRVPGIPLTSLVKPRTEIRRESNKISLTAEEDNLHKDFFDFEEELAGMESARKQFERMEEERMQREKIVTNLRTDVYSEPEAIMFEEIPDPNPIIDPDVPKTCKGIKANGQPCKSLAMRDSLYCKSHSKQA